jgi:uncharacterized protein
MWFELNFQKPDGNTWSARYNSHTSAIEGVPVEGLKDTNFKEAPRVSKDKPLGKSRTPHTLKIQMGLSCNYSCAYCSQASSIKDATISLLSDVDKFLSQLDTWLVGSPSRIELWGGEPFVYWVKIKKLIPALSTRYPNATFLIITNGSLLDREKIDFIKKYNIEVGISHDGPGQHVRGPDPLEDNDKRRWIEVLIAEREGYVSINSVIHKENYNLQASEEWFLNALGDTVPLNFEGIVNVYDAATLHGMGAMTQEELTSLSNQMFASIVDDPGRFSLAPRVKEFVDSIAEGRPIEALGQKCGMDRLDQIAVDLKGNVMTCQNTGAKGSHKIGHVDDFDNIKLNTSTHFAFRKECMECPVVQLCKGSCMFLEGDFFEQSCKNEFAYNMGILRGALYLMTGSFLVGIKREE